MRSIVTWRLLAALAAVAFAGSVLGQEKQEQKSAQKSESKSSSQNQSKSEQKSATSSGQKTEAKSGQQGEAKSEQHMGNKPAVVYRVVSGGSAVMETLLPGTQHEMITMYHMDGPDLMLTHYCAVGNQPRMRAAPGDTKVIKFTFSDGTNMDPAKDGHMHALTLTLVDKDHLKAEWVYFEKGAQAQAETFNLVRKKM